MELIEVWFRFYEELNDYLSESRKGISFSYIIRGTPTVKDAIESLGVPHTDVDMIIVNGEPVGFGCRLKNGDQVSVYPVFETLDISDASPLRPKPLRDPRFILDVHLGRLARYLRLCGFDSLYRNDFNDQDIISISLSDHRIIITRDRELLKNKKVTHGYWIRSQDPSVQIIEVINRFDLRNTANPFTICMECNGKLEAVEKEEIFDRLQPMTGRYFDNFKICRSCGRIYWEGSHFEKMKSFVERCLTD
jgi:uncharacterized protein with PIN domain